MAKRQETAEERVARADATPAEAVPADVERTANGSSGTGRNGVARKAAANGNGHSGAATGGGRTRAASTATTTRSTPRAQVVSQMDEFSPARHAPAKIGPVILVLAEMLTDAVAITTAFALAYWLRFKTDISPRFTDPDNATYAVMLTITVITMLVTFYFSKLYTLKRGASRVDEFYKIAAAVSMGTVLALALNSLILGDKFVYSRQILLVGWVLVIVFVTVARLLYSVLVGELRKHGVSNARVLVIGTSITAYTVAARLEWQRTLGYRVVGLIENTTDPVEPGQKVGKMPVIGSLANLVDIIRSEHVDEIVMALQGASDKDLRGILRLIKDETVSIKVYPDAFQLMTQNEVSVGELGGLPLLSVRDVALRGWNRRIKRAFDILFSAVVLIVTSPLFLLIALAVKISSPGPVFFIQERVGLDNKPFRLVKFRSMKIDANPSGWTTENDPRRTNIGTFIRRFSLDELPQFFNVLIGEMSVVGPRPEQMEYVKEFAEKIDRYLERHREKAGITGWAQVNGFRGDSSIDTRTKLDLYYVENWSVLFDLKIIVRTVIAMFRGKNAY